MSIQHAAIIVASLFSILTPTIFLGVRHAVKNARKEIIRDLESAFGSDKPNREVVIPSFEFVKYKYFMDRPSGDDQKVQDHSALSWAIGALPLALLLFVLAYIVVLIIGQEILAQIEPSTQPAAEKRPYWIWSLCAAFAGGYTFMVRSFYRAINNFDLNPKSFVGAFNNLFIGVGAGQILSLASPNPGNAMVQGAVVSTVLIASFAIAYMPEVAVRAIIARSDLRNFKRENKDIYEMVFAQPVEIIDGIDTEIRDRLADHHIRSTQNLATANPLMLFVETPYGVYQIMDWVAQAQLCCSVGPAKFAKLTPLGIRTLFDLERIACDTNCRNPHLLRIVGEILLSDPDRKKTGTNQDVPDDRSLVIASILIRLDDPHVHRLRQIYIQIGDRLGCDNWRLPVRPCADHAVAAVDRDRDAEADAATGEPRQAA